MNTVQLIGRLTDDPKADTTPTGKSVCRMRLAVPGFNRDATPVFIGCSDIDPHIPLDRVRESVAVFRRMGASVDERIYPRMAHTIVADEIDAVEAMLAAKA